MQGLVLLAIAPALSADAPGYALLHCSFDCPLKLSEPQKLGVDAASRGYPVGASKPLWEVTVVEIDRQAFGEMQKAGANPYEYAKATYLGQTAPAPQKGSRKFVQGEQPSEIFPDSFPHHDHLEVFWLERKEGAGLLLAFRRSPKMDAAQAEKAANAVCASLDWSGF